MTSNTTTGPRDENLSMTIAFVAGLMTGAAIAVLLAPASGRQTRGWIATQGRAAGRRAAGLFDREKAMAVVRGRGVLGLVKRLREPRPATTLRAVERPEPPAVADGS
jgi:hypothetical protein